MFKKRATQPERIDIGDYTPEEYARFLREIRFINQRLGDRTALEKTLLTDVSRLNLKSFTVLDVGAGTGELLGVIAKFARNEGRKVRLVGLDLNDLSVNEIAEEALKFSEISPVRADALKLPFADDSFDYVICSLFTHHLTDAQISCVLPEMFRVARRRVIVIDLQRSVRAWLLYKLFCVAYRISPLVLHDGSLSIRKGFTTNELQNFGEKLGNGNASVSSVAPYRVVLTIQKQAPN